MRRALVLVILAGCDLFFPLDGGEGATVPCDRGTPFPEGKEVRIEGEHSVEGARFDPSQTVAYLSLCPTNGPLEEIKDRCELHQAPYNAATEEFGLISRLGISDPDFYDAYPTITPDTQYILFGSDRENGPHVFYAKKANGGFDTSTVVELNVGMQGTNEPYVVGNGSVLYLAGHDGDFDWNVMRMTGTPPDYTGISAVPRINTTAREFAPVVSDDELEIFFARQDGNENLEIYTATRDRIDAEFSSAQRMGQLSSGSGNDWPLWLSPDNCNLYYINRPDDIGTLYLSTRTP